MDKLNQMLAGIAVLLVVVTFVLGFILFDRLDTLRLECERRGGVTLPGHANVCVDPKILR